MENEACKAEGVETFLEKVKQKIILEIERLQTTLVDGNDSLDRFRGSEPKNEQAAQDYASSLEGDISRELDNLTFTVSRVEKIIGEFSKIV